MKIEKDSSKSGSSCQSASGTSKSCSGSNCSSSESQEGVKTSGKK